MRRVWRMAGAAAVLALLCSPATAQAFTLILIPHVTVSPTSGVASAAFTMRGTMGTPPCTTTFNYSFYWDTTVFLLWATSSPNCDTGNSPAVTPPSADNAVGPHQINLVVTDPSGATGPFTTTASYTIKSPPPPPPPSPRPSPKPPPPPSPVRSSPPSTQPSATTSPSSATSPNCPPGAVTAGCPSPSAAACPAAMLPPPGTGGWADNLIAGAMVLAVIPIAGLALFGPGPLWAAVGRRRRLLMLLGLSAVAAFTLNCTFPTNSTQPVANVSPSASPSSCSA